MCSTTEFEKCLECLINVYHRYSIRFEHYDMLNKGEMKTMIKEQMPNFLKSQKDPKAMDKMFEELDKNKDQQLTFEETMGLVVKALIFCHDKIHEKDHHHGQGQGQGHGHTHGHDHSHKHNH